MEGCQNHTAPLSYTYFQAYMKLVQIFLNFLKNMFEAKRTCLENMFYRTYKRKEIKQLKNALECFR